MGILEADNLRRWSPDLQSVKNACQSAHALGHSAATGTEACVGGFLSSVTVAASKVDQSIRLHGTKTTKEATGSAYGLGIQALQKIKNTVADPDNRDRMAWIGRKLADLFISNVTKPYTGGLPVYRVVMEGLTKAPSGKAAYDDSFGRRLERLEAKVGMMEAKGNPQSSKKVGMMEAKGNPQSSKKVGMMEAKGNPQSSKKVGG